MLSQARYALTIKLYNINENEFKVIQTLNENKNNVNKIIEHKNKQLISCSYYNSIIFYKKIIMNIKKIIQFQQMEVMVQ